MQKRSKIQWMFYLKENFWDLPKNSKLLQKKYWETPNISSQQNKAAFQKFTKKKWAYHLILDTNIYHHTKNNKKPKRKTYILTRQVIIIIA